MTVTVINKHKAKNNTFINIQRPTIFGNYCLGADLVKAYRSHVQLQIAKFPESRFMRELNKLRMRHLNGEHLELGCTCKPKSCHGDVLAEYIETGEVKDVV